MKPTYDDLVKALSELVGEFDERDRIDQLEPGHGGIPETGGIVWARQLLALVEKHSRKWYATIGYGAQGLEARGRTREEAMRFLAAKLMREYEDAGAVAGDLSTGEDRKEALWADAWATVKQDAKVGKCSK